MGASGPCCSSRSDSGWPSATLRSSAKAPYRTAAIGVAGHDQILHVAHPHGLQAIRLVAKGAVEVQRRRRTAAAFACAQDDRGFFRQRTFQPQQSAQHAPQAAHHLVACADHRPLVTKNRDEGRDDLAVARRRGLGERRVSQPGVGPRFRRRTRRRPRRDHGNADNCPRDVPHAVHAPIVWPSTKDNPRWQAAAEEGLYLLLRTATMTPVPPCGSSIGEA